MKRRSFLQQSALIGATSLLPGFAAATEKEKKKSFRFAHITDIHIKPGAKPEAGMTAVLQQINRQKDISFILNTGDCINDALEADKQKTQAQWDLFTSILKKENKLPVYHAIGNHDIWGWFIKDNRPQDDPLYGKQWIRNILSMPNRYYDFAYDHWKFIILDSTQLNPAGGYIAYLDEEQLQWLKQTLDATPKDQFICIASHIPILSICAGLFFDKTEPNGDLKIQRNLMHTDFIKLKKIFRQYPNIRLCLSGHIHLQDELEYLGIQYYCSGAVSGNWWGGAFQEFEPAYAMMDLYPDGSSRRTMIQYEK